MTEAFFEAYLLNAVPAELWPELDVEQTKRRFFTHLKQGDAFLSIALKAFMVGLELFLGPVHLQPRRFSRLPAQKQALLLDKLSHTGSRILQPMVVLLKALASMSAYADEKILKRLGYDPEEVNSLKGCSG